VQEWLQDKFGGASAADPATAHAAESRLLHAWQSRAACFRLDGGRTPAISHEDLVQARDALRATAAPGHDGVPPAILALLDAAALGTIRRAFHARAWAVEAREQDIIQSWAASAVVCIPKQKGDLATLANWRPITVVGCLYKWYEKAFWAALDRYLPAPPTQMVGFVPRRQCAEVGGTIISLLRKATEWSLPLLLVSLDVQAAFDSVQSGVLGEQLHRLGAPAPLVAAVVREHTELVAHPSLGGIDMDPVRLFRGARQGGPCTPRAWNALLQGGLETLLL